MQFDVDRLSRLAGLQSGSRFGKNQLAERGGKKGDEHDAPGGKKRGSAAGDEDYKNEEWGDKQYLDNPDEGPALEEAEDQWSDSDVSIEELDDIDFLGEDDHEDDEQSEQVVLEIDEETLRQEVRRMRSARLEENRLRRAIRNEIRDVFRSAGATKSGSDSSWMYGDNQPRNSRDGYVVAPGRPMPGFGFKK